MMERKYTIHCTLELSLSFTIITVVFLPMMAKEKKKKQTKKMGTGGTDFVVIRLKWFKQCPQLWLFVNFTLTMWIQIMYSVWFDKWSSRLNHINWIKLDKEIRTKLECRINWCNTMFKSLLESQRQLPTHRIAIGRHIRKHLALLLGTHTHTYTPIK